MAELPPEPATRDGLRFVFNRPKTYCAITAWLIAVITSFVLHHDIVGLMLYFLISYVALQIFVFKILGLKESGYISKELLQQQAISGPGLDRFGNVCFYKDLILLAIGLGLWGVSSLEEAQLLCFITGAVGHVLGIGIIQVTGAAQLPSSFIRRGGDSDDSDISGGGPDDKSRQVNWGVYTSSKSREGDTVYQYD